MKPRVAQNTKLIDSKFLYRFKINTLNAIFLLYLISIIWIFIEQLFFKKYGYESWQISEFMINYQGGFVRRG